MTRLPVWFLLAGLVASPFMVGCDSDDHDRDHHDRDRVYRNDDHDRGDWHHDSDWHDRDAHYDRY